jgi:hypothetical protein
LTYLDTNVKEREKGFKEKTGVQLIPEKVSKKSGIDIITNGQSVINESKL